MIDKAIQNKLEKEFSSFKKKSEIVLIRTNSEKYNAVIDAALYTIVNKIKFNGIYVTMNLGYDEINDRLKESKVNTSKIYFIDGISSKMTEKPSADNLDLLQGPSSLTELSLAMTEAANTGKFNFILLDSLTTMLIYNDTRTTQRFAHFILSKMRNLGIGGIIFAIDSKEASEIIPSIASFCNKTITID